jgi:hypothetical protein
LDPSILAARLVYFILLGVFLFKLNVPSFSIRALAAYGDETTSEHWFSLSSPLTLAGIISLVIAIVLVTGRVKVSGDEGQCSDLGYAKSESCTHDLAADFN